MMRRSDWMTRLAALGLCVWGMSGCTEAGTSSPVYDSASSSPELIIPGVSGPGEVSAQGVTARQSEHREPAAIAQGLSMGTLEVRDSEPFVAAYVMMATTGFVAMQMSYERLDGSWTEFAPVEVDEDVIDGARIRLVLPEPARAVRLYASKGADAVTFMATRHYSRVPDRFGAHLDVPGSQRADLAGVGFLAEHIVLGQALAQEGAYAIPEAVVARGATQNVAYEEATVRERDMEGTRRLARYLKQRFPQIILVEGHHIRQNTAGGGYSVHSAGRALDLFIRRDTSQTAPHQADNDLGDPIANWLIGNAESIGVTYMIWDRTKWSASRTYTETNARHAPYEGTHPHDDHIHVEISTAAGNLETEFYAEPATATTDATGMRDAGATDPTGLSCISRHRPSGTAQGECVQGERSWGDCAWYMCDEWGVFTQVEDVSACTQGTFAKRERWCEDEATQREEGCYSRTLDQEVEVGDCIQTEEAQIHCGSCSWMVCTAAGMQCIRQDKAQACQQTDHASQMCEEQPEEPEGPERVNQLVVTLEWSTNVDLDIVVEEPSGQSVSHSNSEPTENDGDATKCNPLINACGDMTPYQEIAYWGEVSGEVVPGSYTIHVRNYSSSEGSPYTVKVERLDAQGQATVLQEFSGQVNARYDGAQRFYEVTPGTVVVP